MPKQGRKVTKQPRKSKKEIYTDLMNKISAALDIGQNNTKVLNRIIAVVLLLEEKGIINEQEINDKVLWIKANYIDGNKKSPQGSPVQPEDSGTDEDRGGDAEPGVLRKGSDSADQSGGDAQGDTPDVGGGESKLPSESEQSNPTVDLSSL